MGRKVRRLLFSLLALAALIIIFFSPLWRYSQAIIQPWLAPFIKVSNSFGVWLGNIWELPVILKENEELRHEIVELSARQSTSQVLNSENEELRQLVSLAAPQGYERVAVEIIGQQIDETGVTYLINRGSQDGLIPGLAAVAGVLGDTNNTSGIVLVGTLVNVGEHVSSLTLITSSKSEVLAQLAQSPEAQSLAKGEYNLAVRLSLVEINQEVSIGDAVITSNLNELIPSGLLIGTVTTVERLENQLFQSAVVSPPVPLEKFRFLFILKPVKANL